MCLVKATMGHDHLSHTPMAVISPNFPITIQPHFCVTSWSLLPVPVECSQNLPKGGGARVKTLVTIIETGRLPFLS
jgi:hypothetical protein